MSLSFERGPIPNRQFDIDSVALPFRHYKSRTKRELEPDGTRERGVGPMFATKVAEFRVAMGRGIFA